jgi:hypothetical protein
MRIDEFSFGQIRIDGVTYEYDVVINHGKVRRRKKKAITALNKRPKGTNAILHVTC